MNRHSFAMMTTFAETMSEKFAHQNDTMPIRTPLNFANRKLVSNCGTYLSDNISHTWDSSQQLHERSIDTALYNKIS